MANVGVNSVGGDVLVRKSFNDVCDQYCWYYFWEYLFCLCH